MWFVLCGFLSPLIHINVYFVKVHAQMMAVRAFAVPQPPIEGLVPHHALDDAEVANNKLNALGGVLADLQNIPLVSDDLFNIPSFYFDQVYFLLFRMFTHT